MEIVAIYLLKGKMTMKKLVIFIFLLSTNFFCFSAEVRIDNIIDTKNPYMKLIYFKDILFAHYYENVDYLDDNILHPVIPNLKTLLQEKDFGKYGVIILTKMFLSKDEKHLFFFADGQREQIFFYGYEIFVDNQGSVSYKAKNEEDINRGDMYYGYKSKSIFNTDIIEINELDMTTFTRNKKLYVESMEGDMLFDFLNFSPSLNLVYFTINTRANKIAVSYHNEKCNTDMKERHKLVLFSIVFDGVINDTRVRLRSKPNLNSEVLGFFNRGDKLKVVDWSNEKQKIGEMEAYWYKVESKNYPDGWVYGKYLDIEE